MAKLSKVQIKQHEAACELLKKDRPTEDDRWFVLENWKESATHINSAVGAFFTPPYLARDFSIEVGGKTIIDLCAGIGTLAYMAWNRAQWDGGLHRIVCVERNPDYLAIGQKVLPEAEWINADVFDLPSLGYFDCAISNPPFGSTKRKANSPRYSGNRFEYHVIDIASDLAGIGVFIVPQQSAPFEYSGKRHYAERKDDEYKRFVEQTGIELGPNCGIDCSVYQGDWNGVAPAVEIVTADFTELQAKRRADAKPDQPDLFSEAA